MLKRLVVWVTRQRNISSVLLFALILTIGFTTSLKAGPKTDKKRKNKSGKLAKQQNERGEKGEWNTVSAFTNPVVASHVSVLPNGRLIAWGPTLGGTNGNQTIVQIWDPTANCPQQPPPTPQPPPQPPQPGQCLQAILLPVDYENLYCSGHSFLPDGRLLITGGTPTSTPPDQIPGYASGTSIAALFDYAAGSFTLLPQMNDRRWYPTNLTLPNGNVLVWGGFALNSAPNLKPQVLEKQTDGSFTWRTLNVQNPDLNFSYYTWLNILSSGKTLVTVGVDAKSYLLTVGGIFRYPKDYVFKYPRNLADPAYDGALTESHESGSTIVFDKDQLIAIGGGAQPKYTVEKIDLNNPNPQWQKVGRLNIPRRHHNSTILPDGKVLVTGGNKGNGLFNNTCPENAVKEAELWDPADPGIADQSGKWKLLAAATQTRIYHSSAVLLPDGRVFTGGTTEFVLTDKNNNQIGDGTGVNGPCPPLYGHNYTIEIFSPPYLFNADGTPATRPQINNAPAQVAYGQTINFTVTGAGSGSKVNLVRLPSTTHSFNQNQAFVKLQANVTPIEGQPNNFSFSVPIPANRNELVPGHYMMFVLNSNGVPSKAAIIQVL